jgi:hypothetical protein
MMDGFNSEDKGQLVNLLLSRSLLIMNEWREWIIFCNAIIKTNVVIGTYMNGLLGNSSPKEWQG